jgi:hypothetical protein
VSYPMTAATAHAIALALRRRAIGRVENAVILGLGERSGRAEDEPETGEEQRSTQCSHEMPP